MDARTHTHTKRILLHTTFLHYLYWRRMFTVDYCDDTLCHCFVAIVCVGMSSEINFSVFLDSIYCLNKRHGSIIFSADLFSVKIYTSHHCRTIPICESRPLDTSMMLRSNFSGAIFNSSAYKSITPFFITV